MTDTPQPAEPPPDHAEVDIHAAEVNIGGDVVGRDKIISVGDDLIQGNVTNVTQIGFTPEAVRRLIITVGVLVAATAACFFAGGILIGGAAIAALNRPIDSNPGSSAEFQQGLDEIAARPAGQEFRISFTEEQLSSYIRFGLGPQLGLSNGRARILPDGRVVFYGSWSGLAGLPVMVTCSIQTDTAQIFKIDSAAVQIVPLSLLNTNTVSNVGWTPAPNFFAQPLVDGINAQLSQYFVVTQPLSPGSGGAAGGFFNLQVRAR
jgi:hypothetical protein